MENKIKSSKDQYGALHIGKEKQMYQQKMGDNWLGTSSAKKDYKGYSGLQTQYESAVQ